MIVRERPSGLQLFFVLRGSILKQIRWVMLANIGLAVLVTVSHGTLFHYKLQVTTIPFTLMGLPLAIFLGFRNNACYDRFWEARKLWGDILLRSRNLSRQVLTLIGPSGGAAEAGAPDALQRRMVHRAIAFAHALKHQLRGTPDAHGEVPRWLPPSEAQALVGVGNPAAQLMLHMGRDLSQAQRERRLDSVLTANIDQTLSGLTAAAASCERIKNTPLPFPYTLLLHRTAYLYCFLLPFGLVDSIGPLTPFVVAVVAYTFFGLDALGDELEEPFGLLTNDLPLDAICRTLENDLRQSLGDTDLAPPLQPVDFCLM